MDALYAGTPVVTRSDLQHMAARVTASANIVLDIEEMNSNGIQEYIENAVRMAHDSELYSSVRNRLVESALMENPMHPFWDVEKYVKNFETGLALAFRRYVEGSDATHIRVADKSYIEEVRESPNDEL